MSLLIRYSDWGQWALCTASITQASRLFVSTDPITLQLRLRRVRFSQRCTLSPRPPVRLSDRVETLTFRLWWFSGNVHWPIFDKPLWKRITPGGVKRITPGGVLLMTSGQITPVIPRVHITWVMGYVFSVPGITDFIISKIEVNLYVYWDVRGILTVWQRG